MDNIYIQEPYNKGLGRLRQFLLDTSTLKTKLKKIDSNREDKIPSTPRDNT